MHSWRNFFYRVHSIYEYCTRISSLYCNNINNLQEKFVWMSLILSTSITEEQMDALTVSMLRMVCRARGWRGAAVGALESRRHCSDSSSFYEYWLRNKASRGRHSKFRALIARDVQCECSRVHLKERWRRQAVGAESVRGAEAEAREENARVGRLHVRAARRDGGGWRRRRARRLRSLTGPRRDNDIKRLQETDERDGTMLTWLITSSRCTLKKVSLSAQEMRWRLA